MASTSHSCKPPPRRGYRGFLREGTGDRLWWDWIKPKGPKGAHRQPQVPARFYFCYCFAFGRSVGVRAPLGSVFWCKQRKKNFQGGDRNTPDMLEKLGALGSFLGRAKSSLTLFEIKTLKEQRNVELFAYLGRIHTLKDLKDHHRSVSFSGGCKVSVPSFQSRTFFKKVVLQNSAPPQICQRILYYY